jgi:hypothetical protein
VAPKIFIAWLPNATRALDQQEIPQGTITAQNAHKAKKFSVIDRDGPPKSNGRRLETGQRIVRTGNKNCRAS